MDLVEGSGNGADDTTADVTREPDEDAKGTMFDDKAEEGSVAVVLDSSALGAPDPEDTFGVLRTYLRAEIGRTLIRPVQNEAI